MDLLLLLLSLALAAEPAGWEAAELTVTTIAERDAAQAQRLRRTLAALTGEPAAPAAVTTRALQPGCIAGRGSERFTVPWPGSVSRGSPEWVAWRGPSSELALLGPGGKRHDMVLDQATEARPLPELAFGVWTAQLDDGACRDFLVESPATEELCPVAMGEVQAEICTVLESVAMGLSWELEELEPVHPESRRILELARCRLAKRCGDEGSPR